MLEFLKTYKAFGFGFLITLLLFIVLQYLRVISIDPKAFAENGLIFIFWWIVISLPIHEYAYLKRNRIVIFKVLGLMALFFLLLFVDSYMAIPDNPISILLLVVLGISSFHLVAPTFFNKNRIFILGFYLLTCCYFLLARLLTQNVDTYLHHKSIFVVLFFAPIPFILVFWLYDQWKWFQTLKAEKASAELELLKTQINPHFFFNTLNNLHALTVTNSKKAPEVVLKLAEMMRYTIYEGKKDRVILKDEVAYLETYIDLHKIRYHKSVSIEFEHAIEEEETIAPLLFIILLENALKHGVEKLTENAFVKMNLWSTQEEIHFTIKNNYEADQASEKPGIGLKNLKRRLALTYPEKHSLTIAAKENIFEVELIISKQ